MKSKGSEKLWMNISELYIEKTRAVFSTTRFRKVRAILLRILGSTRFKIRKMLGARTKGTSQFAW